MPVFDRSGIRFSYSLEGEGLPLVLIHGLGGDLSQPLALVGDLPSYKRVSVDCRAHGNTAPVGPHELLNFGQLADDVIALVSKLRIERPILLGVSMGAGVCASIAARWPDLARALVLVRPAWLDKPSPPNLALFSEIGHLLHQYGAERGKDRFRLMAAYREVDAASPAAAASLLSQFDASLAVQRRARLERLPACCPVHSLACCQSIACPTLVVATDADPVHPLEFGRTWAQAIPSAKFVQIPSKSASAEAHTTAFRGKLQQFLTWINSGL